MKEIVDRIRNLCKQNGTSITKLEEKLGYANGTIGKWAKAKKKPPLEKVIDIARELDTTVEYIMNGAQKEKADSPKGTGLSPAKQEAWEFIQNMDDETLSRFIAAAKAMLGE